MTKAQLNFAQYLLGVYERGHYFLGVARIQASDSRRDDVERAIIQMTVAAKGAFYELTGRSPHRVSMTELNNISPAPWTKLAGKDVYPKTEDDDGNGLNPDAAK